MEVAKILVTDVCTRVLKAKKITSGMIGATVSFVFDDTWDGLTKTVVYRCGGVTRDETIEGTVGTIPAEVLAKSGWDLMVGVYGTCADDTEAIPTLWANLGRVHSGADPSGDPAADPSLPIWAQILAKLGNLADLNTKAKENLVAAINEALTKGGGEVDDEAIDAAVKKYLTADKMVISVNSKTGVVELAAEDVGADPAGSAADAVSQHNVATDSHADLRLELQNLADRVNAVLDSDDITLDELSEIVAYIKSNKTLIDAITTSKVSVTDIIDNLVTNVANKPLSAAQGVVLKGMIEEIRGLVPPAYTLPVGGNELGGVKNGGNVTINGDGTMTAPEVSGGSGIAVTGATVGQMVKIAAVDEKGVPTAWEPVDMPSGGEDVYELISDIETEEDVAYMTICSNLSEYKKLYVVGCYNMSAAYSIGLYANDRAASAYWLFKFTYGNYLGRAFAFLIDECPTGHTRIVGGAWDKSDAFSPIKLIPTGGGQGHSPVNTVIGDAPRFPIYSLGLHTGTTDKYILQGAKFRVYGVKR